MSIIRMIVNHYSIYFHKQLLFSITLKGMNKFQFFSVSLRKIIDITLFEVL